MHLCCESTRFEHRVIVDRGANETCPRSAGVRSAAHVAARSASSTMRAIVSRVRDALRRHFRTKTSSNFRSRIGIFRTDRVLLFAFSIHESGSHGQYIVARTVKELVRARGFSVSELCVLAASLCLRVQVTT
jgi:hypothetical protein